MIFDWILGPPSHTTKYQKSWRNFTYEFYNREYCCSSVKLIGHDNGIVIYVAECPCSSEAHAEVFRGEMS